MQGAGAPPRGAPVTKLVEAEVRDRVAQGGDAQGDLPARPLPGGTGPPVDVISRAALRRGRCRDHDRGLAGGQEGVASDRLRVDHPGAAGARERELEGNRGPGIPGVDRGRVVDRGLESAEDRLLTDRGQVEGLDTVESVVRAALAGARPKATLGKGAPDLAPVLATRQRAVGGKDRV